MREIIIPIRIVIEVTHEHVEECTAHIVRVKDGKRPEGSPGKRGKRGRKRGPYKKRKARKFGLGTVTSKDGEKEKY